MIMYFKPSLTLSLPHLATIDPVEAARRSLPHAPALLDAARFGDGFIPSYKRSLMHKIKNMVATPIGRTLLSSSPAALETSPVGTFPN